MAERRIIRESASSQLLLNILLEILIAETHGWKKNVCFMPSSTGIEMKKSINKSQRKTFLITLKPNTLFLVIKTGYIYVIGNLWINSH